MLDTNPIDVVCSGLLFARRSVPRANEMRIDPHPGRSSRRFRTASPHRGAVVARRTHAPEVARFESCRCHEGRLRCLLVRRRSTTPGIDVTVTLWSRGRTRIRTSPAAGSAVRAWRRAARTATAGTATAPPLTGPGAMSAMVTAPRRSSWSVRRATIGVAPSTGTGRADLESGCSAAADGVGAFGSRPVRPTPGRPRHGSSL